MNDTASFNGLDFSTRRSLQRSSLLSFFQTQKRLYLLTEMPGNLGDNLIWAGTTDLLDTGSIHYTPLPLSSLRTEERPDATLLVPGSGALTKWYHEWLPITILDGSRLFEKVIILPSSYDVTVPSVGACLSRPNVYAFAREIRSYRAVKAFGRAALSLDCALYFHGFADLPAFDDQVAENGRPLLALREDKESLLHGRQLQPNPEANDDISLTKSGLHEWIEAIAQASTVITDRLHVAVASVLLGKALIYLDPDGLKISNYFQFAFRDGFDERIRRCSVEWLLSNHFVTEKRAA